MNPSPDVVLQLVSHCAGRTSAPTVDELDETSNRIRIVTEYLVRARLRGGVTLAERCVTLNARAGGGPVLDLLLLVIGELACLPMESKPRRAQEPGPVAAPDPEAGGGEQVCFAGDTSPATSPRVAPAPAPAEGPCHRRHRRRPRSLPMIPRERECPPDRSTCDRAKCRHHLGLDAPHPCVLVLAAIRGSMSLEEVGMVLGGITREAVRQIQGRALVRLKERHGDFDFEEVVHKQLTYVERAELLAPGSVGLDLRGAPENWGR